MAQSGTTKFHDPNTLSQVLHSTFVLFASMFTRYVSTWLVFSSDIAFLHFLHFAWIICTRMQSTPSNVMHMQDLKHDTIMFRRCLYHKYSVGCLEGTSRYFCSKDYPSNCETRQDHISVAALDVVSF